MRAANESYALKMNIIVILLRFWNVMFQNKNEWSLEAYRFKSLVSIKVFFLKYYNDNGNTRQKHEE